MFAKMFSLSIFLISMTIGINTASAQNYYEAQRADYLAEHPLFAQLFAANEIERRVFVASHRAKAQAGDAKSMLLLGLALQSGFGIEQNQALALDWLQKAAEQGENRAIYAFAAALLKEEARSGSDLGAVAWMKKAAEDGYAKAEAAYGAHLVMALDDAETTQGVKWLEKSFDQGHIQAAVLIARCYSFGFGVDRDWDKMIEWYKKAAELGHPTPQFILASEHNNGHGLLKSRKQAKFWAEKAAAQGVREATDLLKKIEANE